MLLSDVKAVGGCLLDDLRLTNKILLDPVY